MEHWLNENISITSTSLPIYWRLAILAGIILVAYLVDIIFNYVVIPLIQKMTRKTETEWDDILLSDRVCRSFSAILPPIILLSALPYVLSGTLEVIITKLMGIYLVINVCRFITSAMRAVYGIFLYEEEKKQKYKATSLRGILQTLQIVVWILGVIIMLSLVVGRSPLYLLTGLGAAATVLMLVFQDSIKGLVAGVQLSLNDMVRVGDWICMPARGVDGVVSEITLSTVKVRNWDNTILTILPYSLITDTFQNWRGMTQSDGRRLSRSVNVSMHSVHFLDAREVTRYQAQGWLPADAKAGVATNLEAMRGCLVQYLRQHPAINSDMTLMVRQLPATTEGLPVQLYAFTRTKVWEEYEEIQATLIEYMVALMPKFGILPYQRSSDFRQHV